MKNSDYWKQRFLILEESANGNAVSAFHDMEEQLRKAQKQLENQIQGWYSRFAKNNEISMVEARRLLNTNELNEFHWDVKEYIKYGEQADLNLTWMKQLENASAKFHITRLEALRIQTQQTVEVLFGNQVDVVDKLMKRTYLNNYYHTAYEIHKGFNIGWDIAAVNDKTLQKIISKPWTPDGKTFSDRMWQDKQNLIGQIHTQLSQNIILGKAPDDAIKTIAKQFGTSKSNAGRLVMTESAYFASLSQKDAFNELDVERFEIVATLDLRTSEICQQMDGQNFPMADCQPGATAPPFHPWCRTTTVPYFDDDFGERAARGEDGKTYYVPSNMKYPDWKNTFVDGGSKDGLKTKEPNVIIDNNWVGLKYSANYTKQEAINQLKNEYGIQFQDSKKYPMDSGLLGDCVGWMDSFSSQYSGFMKNNPCRIPVIENKAPSKMGIAVGSYTYYSHNAGVVGLSLNAAYHSDIKYFQQYIDHCVQSKWYPANAVTHKTFVHEFGHHVANSMKWISKDPNWENTFISECISAFKQKNSSYEYSTYVGMGDFVSRYGASSNSELFAEAFAEYFGGSNPREFAMIFGKKLEELLKGVK